MFKPFFKIQKTGGAEGMTEIDYSTMEEADKAYEELSSCESLRMIGIRYTKHYGHYE